MMKYRCVISNSSPLMNLAIIGQLDLVKTLFGRVLVPQEVWHDLTVAGKGKPGSTLIRQAEWIERVELGHNTLYPLLRKDLDDGEAAAIALALEKQADLILLDETDARNVAELYRIPKTGVIGILTRAKQHHLLQEVKPLFDALKTQANFWIQPRLYEALLKKVGE
jgi:predicted nucleic acid-binding protein